MLQLRRNALRGLGAVAALTALTMAAGGGAWAEESFVVNRSAPANAAVGAHSAAWDQVSLDTVLTVILGLPQSVADCVEGLAPAAGIPDTFVWGGKQAQGSGGVIAKNNPNFPTGLSSDGKGIDQAEVVYGPILIALIGQCSV